MDETSGASAYDSSGNSLTGTATGTTITSGKFGNSRNFAGGNYITIGSSSIVNSIANQLTVSAWVNDTTPSRSYDYIVSNDRDCCGAYKGYSLWISGSHAIFQIWDSNSAQHSLTSIQTISAGTWTHLTGVFDGKTLYIYINGVLDNTVSFSGTIGTPATYPFYIGGMGLDPSTYDILGQIDEVRVYNRGLSAIEVNQLYNYAPGPIAYYNFDEGSGATFSDLSGNGNNGTLNGSTLPQWVTGKYGGGIRFTGVTDQNAYVPNIGNIMPTKEITVEFWQKPDSVSGQQEGFWIGNDTPDRINFHFTWSGTSYWDFGTCCTPRIGLTQDAAIGRWDHYALVSSVYGNYMREYKNGILVGSNTTPGTFTPAKLPIVYRQFCIW